MKCQDNFTAYLTDLTIKCGWAAPDIALIPKAGYRLLCV